MLTYTYIYIPTFILIYTYTCIPIYIYIPMRMQWAAPMPRPHVRGPQGRRPRGRELEYRTPTLAILSSKPIFWYFFMIFWETLNLRAPVQYYENQSN